MPVQTRGATKRVRDDSDVSEEERASKRPSTPFFRRVEPSFHERARSARKATPARAIRPTKAYSSLQQNRFRLESLEDLPALKPFGEETVVEPEVNTVSAAVTPPQQNQQSRIGWLWNSARKYIPGFRGEENEPPPKQDEVEQNDSPSSSRQAMPRCPLESLDQPFEYPRIEPRPRSELEESYAILRRMKVNKPEDFDPVKRAKKWDFAAKGIARDARLGQQFNTKQVTGTNKRKLTDEPEESEQPATPPRNSFRLPSVEDDDDDDVAEVAVAQKYPDLFLKTPDPKQSLPGPSPLKSALRTGTKSKMNVGFDESSIKPASEPPGKTKWRNYGPAGHYTGSTFRDPSDPLPKKSAEKSHDESPDFYISTDPKFLQPNTFGLSDEDITYEVTPEEEAEIEAQLAARAAQSAATPPSAPRPSHAELPSGPKQGGIINAGDTQPTPLNANGRPSTSKPAQSEMERIEQQRKMATKYKPKKTSGLSHVEPARSRSSSPPRASSATATADADNEVPALSDDNGDASDEPTSPSTPSLAATVNAIPPAPPELDNTTPGEDGMTDYQREHQFDEWAKNLPWPKPQSYVEAGVCSAYMDDLLRTKWTKEDERITREWWTREFDDVQRLMEAASRKGARLELVVGEEGATY